MSTPKKWHQFFVVEGKALRRLRTFMDLSGVGLQGGIVLHGLGDHFPTVEGFEFSAACFPARDSETGPTDLRMVFDFLINESFLIATDTATPQCRVRHELSRR